MANPPPDGIADDFFEQIFSMPPYGSGGESGMVGVHLSSGEASGVGGGGFLPGTVFPLALSLDHGKDEESGKDDVKAERDSVQLGSLFPGYGHVHTHQIRPTAPQVFHGQGMHAAAPQPPAPRPRVRARRGQATDPHSIAERLRRERIAERLRALQDLVPNTNKTDRAVMLDEILDYVKFLRLQVKVLSMSRMGGTGAVAQLVADIPLSSHEGEAIEGGSKQQAWEKWSTDGTERQVAKLMEEDVGAAMQFLQSKALCMMPISLATAIYPTLHEGDNPQAVKPEPHTPS